MGVIFLGTDAPQGERCVVFSVKQVAQKLNVKLSTVYAAIRSGLLRCYRIRCRGDTRGTIRITEEQLREYLEAGEVPTSRTPPSKRDTFSQLDSQKLAASWGEKGVLPSP